MKASSLLRFVPALALLFALSLGGIVQAQPIFPTASGCKESAILTTEQFLNPSAGAFTQDRTVIPGEDTQVVLGSVVFVDGFVTDPTAGVGTTPNCPAALVDTNPTYVVKVVVKPASGDPVAAGITRLTWWADNDLDGQITLGKDTQINSVDATACLTSPQGCELSFGNRPVVVGAPPNPFIGLAPSPVPLSVLGSVFPPGICGNIAPPRGGPTCAGLILVGDIANPKPGATLQVRFEGFASDLVNATCVTPGAGGCPAAGTAPFSSDFAPQYKKATSNTRVVVQGVANAPGVLSPGVNNGSGNPETGTLGIETLGIRTRDDRGGLAGTQERDARPGDREYFVGIVGLCDNGELVTNRVTLLPPIAGASPTIAGGLAAIPCIPTAAGTDGLNTVVTRIRVGVSGPGAQFVQAVHIYADTSAVAGATGWLAAGLPGTAAATFFESGEQVLSGIPVNSVVAVGSLEQVLTTSGGTPLIVASATGVPALLYFTADIDDRAAASEVRFQVAIDVADTPSFGIFCVPNCRSSRLLRTAPQEFIFQISGPTAPPGGVAQFDTNKNGVIDDAEFFAAIDQWVAGAVSDQLFFQVLDAWVSQSPVGGASVKGLSLQAVSLSTSARAATFVASGQGIEGLRVEIFDLDGQRIFAQETAGTRLTWTLSAQEGQPVANGVYLYVVTVKGANGETLRSEVKKLVVLR